MLSQYNFTSGCGATLNRNEDDTYEMVFRYPPLACRENVVRSGSREEMRDLMRSLDSEYRFNTMANFARCYP